MSDFPQNLPILQPRARDSHKGNHGNLGVMGGSAGMVGAALLAARAALYLGAGRVFVGLLEDTLKVDVTQPELMFRPVQAMLSQSLVAQIVGPGLGQSPQAVEALGRALQRDLPTVLDADALNLIASGAVRAQWQAAQVVMTPHAGEAARLLKTSAEAIQANRVQSALKLAEKYQVIVVLKGAGSVVANPQCEHWINASGSPALATAGMGDVLSGMIGALIAQGMPLWDAARLAVYLHGAAADVWAEKQGGEIGLTASELMLEARRLLNQWMREKA